MVSNIMDLFDVSGKVAVITGGGGELCGAMATALGSIGVKVAILDLNVKSARRVVNEIEKTGGQALAIKCNVLDSEELRTCHQAICQKWDGVDFLVPGAGGNDPRGTTSEEFLEAHNMRQLDGKNFYLKRS